MRRMDFLYFFGSVYAGLTVLRIGRLAEAAGVSVRWRPFNVRPLMQENNVALRTEARKIQYMWRDVARRAALHGVPYATQPVWPTDPELLHNKVGMVAADEGWIEPFTVASIRAWFLNGMALGEDSCLTQVLTQCGRDKEAVLAAAKSERITALYESNTEEARSHGIFGSPSFVTEDGQLFWGDDRLEEALAWAAGTHPLQNAT